MRLPFSAEQFLGVFRIYNLAVWPAQPLLVMVGLAIVFIARRRTGRWQIWSVAGGLALLWTWMGAIYHLTFFADINPAARLFGVAFLIQSLLWLIWAWRTPTVSFTPIEPVRRVVGAALLVYAFVAYPLLNLALGHRYPEMPTFGAPCPTTIATFGLLTWATPRPPWFVWPIPILWAFVGTSAAIMLGIREDFGLLPAAVLAVALPRENRVA